MSQTSSLSEGIQRHVIKSSYISCCCSHNYCISQRRVTISIKQDDNHLNVLLRGPSFVCRLCFKNVQNNIGFPQTHLCFFSYSFCYEYLPRNKLSCVPTYSLPNLHFLLPKKLVTLFPITQNHSHSTLHSFPLLKPNNT